MHPNWGPNKQAEVHELKKRKERKETWNTTKQNQETETQKRRTSVGTELPENKEQNDYRKPSYISTYRKCKCTEFTNKEAHSRRLNQKVKPNHMLLSRDTSVKGWKIILQVNSIHRKAGVAILISDKIDLKITNVTRNKDGYFIMIKGALHQEDITLLNLYVPNQGAPKYIKQLLIELKEETDQNTIIVGDLNTPLRALDKLPKQKINKEVSALNGTLY